MKINIKKSLTDKMPKIFKFTLIIAIIASISSITTYAASFQYPGLLDNKYQVIENLDNYTPTTDSYPFKSGTTINSVGLPTLWGEDKPLMRYLGEVPYYLKDDSVGSKLRVYNGTIINGKSRNWSNGSTTTGNGNTKLSNITENSDDLHIKALVYTTPSNGAEYIVYQIMYFINKVINIPLTIILWLKSVDMTSILTMVDKTGGLSDTFNTLFLISPGGDISPFLLIMLILFILSLVSVIIKVVKGEKSGALVLRELGFFILAACLAGIAMASSAKTNISKFGINLSTSITNDITAASSTTSGLYLYSTNNLSQDNDMTQTAFLKKPNIDMIIQNQFGVPVSELDIKDASGKNTGNFGSQALTALDDVYNKNTFEVNNGATSVYNLGYYWWAADSLVDEKSPISGSTYNSSTNDRVLFIIDFLNDARVRANQNKETAVVNRIDTIINHLWAPNYNSSIASVFLLTILSLAMTFAFFIDVIFMTIGKLIVSIGIFAIPILPGLFLYSKTRDLSKKICSTYFVGFIRYIVGLLVFNLICMITSTLSNYGIPGIVIAIIICFIIGKLMPKFIMYLNNQLSYKELRFMQPVSNGMNKYCSAVVKNRDRYNKEHVSIDKQGNITEGENKPASHKDSYTNDNQNESNNTDNSNEANENNKLQSNKPKDKIQPTEEPKDIKVDKNNDNTSNQNSNINQKNDSNSENIEAESHISENYEEQLIDNKQDNQQKKDNENEQETYTEQEHKSEQNQQYDIDQGLTAEQKKNLENEQETYVEHELKSKQSNNEEVHKPMKLNIKNVKDKTNEQIKQTKEDKIKKEKKPEVSKVKRAVANTGLDIAQRSIIGRTVVDRIYKKNNGKQVIKFKKKDKNNNS
jgi:hypothetical protein